MALAASDFTGSAACTECHPKHDVRQAASHHANALRPIAQTVLPKILAQANLRERSGVEFEYRSVPQGVIAAASMRGKRAEMLLEWAFGAGAQGVTPVGRAGSRYVEHRISYFTEPDHPGLTIGHPPAASRDPASALGVPQPAETISRCFRCHSTGTKEGPDLSEMEAGVRCERCHGPGRAHIEAARSGANKERVRTATFNAARFPARRVVEICAECHRAPGDVDTHDPVSIRFQPVGLMASRCFQKSGALSCLTCHDPHEDARPAATGHYTSKCVACHASVGKPAVKCRRDARENCVECHMPRSSPLPHIHFTDHRIR